MMLMLVCIAFMGAITSCLSDNDNEDNVYTLTPSQKAAQIFEMGGTFYGHLFFTNDSTLKLDSIPCVWNLSAKDSVLSIPNFPVELFANGIYDNNIKQSLLNGGTVPFNAVVHPYYNNNHTKGYYTFWTLVDDDKMQFTLNNDGTSHDVTVNFAYQMTVYHNWANGATFSSIGEYMDNEFLAYILVKDVIFDGKTCKTTWPSYIYGKK